MKRIPRFFTSIIAVLIALALLPMQQVWADDAAPVWESVVAEDAYIREGGTNANRNFSSELITKNHGPQYEGKGYRVINSKYQQAGSEIIGVMKFNLPTAEEIKDGKVNRINLAFDIFKNADPNVGDQTYQFFYTTDNSWEESKITWNNKPATITRNSKDLLATLDIKKGFAYENLDDASKHIELDITAKVQELVDAGENQITVFVVAKNPLGTSLLIHCKETQKEGCQPKLRGYSRKVSSEQLAELINECEALHASDYTEESFSALQTALVQAKEIAANQDSSNEDMIAAYDSLSSARDALVSLADPNDPGNLAYGRSARSNLSKTDAPKVVDGDISTAWSGTFFPSYVDIDLGAACDISSVKAYFPKGKTVSYTLYGSNDGSTFDKLGARREKIVGSEDGDEITFPDPKSYRIIRVYVEYTKGEDKAYLSEVKVFGTRTENNTGDLRTGSIEDILGIEPFSETKYAAPITDSETIENVYGIVDRTVGSAYRSWFSFEIAPGADNGNDYFELSDRDGKIHIKGNKGLSLATGLNYYYKNYVNVHISEQAKQVAMPDAVVPIGKTVRKETPYRVRYAYNYCTLSYTFAFFDEEDWQRENDWLALNGVNVVMDLAGQEATWVKFLMNFGYSFDDAKDWLTNPAYSAWQFMDNMEAFGGPVSDQFIVDRLNMARSTQRWKRSLGMQTIMQGYAGMVPTNFNEYQKDVQVIKQGGWNGFSRPDMIATDSATYDEYAELFYEAQEYVYGETSDYYAVDPFHEGGKRPSGLSDATIADEVLNSMLDYDKDAVWVVQGWQSNPTNDLLKGMGDRREDHVLIVDLIKYPIDSWTKYDRTSYGSTKLDAAEFNGTSWAWGLLANFGGNPSMHGEMEVMVNDILEAQATSKHMAGIGIISEAQYDNPVMYDLIFDLVWADGNFDLDAWLDGYIERRYGGISENARQAWKIMKDANYDYGVRYTNELFGMKSKAPQDYKAQTIPYGAEKLETALKLLMEDFDSFKGSEAYLYDLTEISRQVVSNYAVLSYNDLLSARDSRDFEAFKAGKESFLQAFAILNEVESTQKEQLGGEWIGKAQDWAARYDDFSKEAFEMSAKSLITSWGSRAGFRSLKDYGWRNYEGIFKDVYTKIWTDYVNAVERSLETGEAVKTIAKNDYFDFYWDWILGDQEYTRIARDSAEDVKSAVDKVLSECALTDGLDPNIGNLAKDRPVHLEAALTQGKAEQLVDGSTDGAVGLKTDDAGKLTIDVDLIAEFDLSKIQVAGAGGDAAFEVFASADGNEWARVGSSSDIRADDQGTWTFAPEGITARFVRIAGLQGNLSLSEIRAYGNRILPTLDQLASLVDAAESLDLSANAESDLKDFRSALAEAKKAVQEEAAPDTVDGVYWSLYDAIAELDLSGYGNVALKKPVTAHNDPSGNSSQMVDGNADTSWNSGRLSTTGKPYEDTITPGWAIVDLDGLYEITSIDLSFGSSTIWYQYELYTSLDGENWVKVGEKKDEALPGPGDSYALTDVYARYIKLATTNIQEDSKGKRNSFNVRELVAKGKPAVVDTTVLVQLIAEADGKTESDYTTESWSKLEEALNEAKAVLRSSDPMPNEIAQAEKQLRGALDGLVKKDESGKDPGEDPDDKPDVKPDEKPDEPKDPDKDQGGDEDPGKEPGGDDGQQPDKNHGQDGGTNAPDQNDGQKPSGADENDLPATGDRSLLIAGSACVIGCVAVVAGAVMRRESRK